MCFESTVPCVCPFRPAQSACFAACMLLCSQSPVAACASLASTKWMTDGSQCDGGAQTTLVHTGFPEYQLLAPLAEKVNNGLRQNLIKVIPTQSLSRSRSTLAPLTQQKPRRRPKRCTQIVKMGANALIPVHTRLRTRCTLHMEPHCARNNKPLSCGVQCRLLKGCMLFTALL